MPISLIHLTLVSCLTNSPDDGDHVKIKTKAEGHQTGANATLSNNDIQTAKQQRDKQISQQNQTLFELDRKRDATLQNQEMDVGQAFDIFLLDGSILKGEIIDVENGVWKIKSTNIGILSVPSNNILKLQRKGIDKGSSRRTEYTPAQQKEHTVEIARSSGIQENNLNLAQIKSVQNSLTADPSTIMSISQLQSNTAVMSVLADPEVMKLMQNGDLTALQHHPKMKELMNDPSIRQILSLINP